MKQSKKTKNQYSVDKVMRNISMTLVRDFQTDLNDPTFCSIYQQVGNVGDISGVREIPMQCEVQSESTAKFKAAYQLDSLFKRYRFKKDLYTESELIEASSLKFRKTQARLATVDLNNLSRQHRIILDRAASYVARVLGPYDEEEHRRLCMFGKRASVGIPARLACEGARWEIPISGSQQQIDWFDSEMSQYPEVQEYLNNQLERDPQGSIYQPTSCLTMTLVPKTYKSLRSIMPNTTIGSYMSYGLGVMMADRLQRRGHDIRTLQVEHRKLAQSSSARNSHVTADLSAASDSITEAMVHRLLPPDWCRILDQSRIKQVLLPDGTLCDSLTYCTMGIGYTFPLQTLIFRALLKAIDIQYFMNTSLVSVYGDDMIYHRRLHSFVLRFFEGFGLILNVDKTFADGNFRESCGGDYHCGRDVRPFQPRNGQSEVGRIAYEATLYKLINGLLARWDECEISTTLAYLTSEILTVVHAVKVVPHDYPDDSGIKCPKLRCFEFLKHRTTLTPKYLGHGLYRFIYLRFKPEVREEVRHEPYYWRKLSPTADEDHNYDHRSVAASPRFFPLTQRIADVIGIPSDFVFINESVTLLITKKTRPKSFYRSSLSGKRLRRTSTYVTVSHTGRYTRQKGCSCFEQPKCQ